MHEGPRPRTRAGSSKGPGLEKGKPGARGTTGKGLLFPRPALHGPEGEGLPKAASRCLSHLFPAQLPSALGADSSRARTLLIESILERLQRAERDGLAHVSPAWAATGCCTGSEGEGAAG